MPSQSSKARSGASPTSPRPQRRSKPRLSKLQQIQNRLAELQAGQPEKHKVKARLERPDNSGSLVILENKGVAVRMSQRRALKKLLDFGGPLSSYVLLVQLAA